MFHLFNVFRYNEAFNIKDRTSNLKKFECDFSKVLLISLVKQFTGLKLDEYLNAFWTHFNSEEIVTEILEIFLVHVCRFHIIKDLKKNFKKMFPDKVKFQLMSRWGELLVRTRSMRYFDQRIKDIAMLLSYELITDEITQIISYYSGNGTSPSNKVYKI